MIELHHDKDDDPAYVRRIADITTGMLLTYRPDRVFCTSVRGWFDAKWLGFSGKILGAVGVWRSELTLPPFNPNRVICQDYGTWHPHAERYVSAHRRASIHRWQTSSRNLSRKLHQFGKSVAFVWYSSQLGNDDRASIMVYVNTRDSQVAWHAQFQRKDDWIITRLTKISRELLEQMIGRGEEYRGRAEAQIPTEEDLIVRELHKAIQEENLVAVSDAIARGPNVEGRSLDGCTPLHLAVRTGNATFVEVILKVGGNVHAHDYDGWGTLHWAVLETDEQNCVAILDKIITAGAAINATNAEGSTPLMIAVSSGLLVAAERLIEAGADVNIKDSDGDTALHGAAWWDKPECVRALLKAGASISSRNCHRETPLHEAARNGCCEVIADLVAAGANLATKNKYKNSPLAAARISKQEEAVALLEKLGG